jgi:hypothetical protein
MNKVVKIMTNVNINNTNENLFIGASEVGKLLGVCRSKAYKIIQELNDELKAKGYIIIQGKTHRAYFLEKIYGQVA